MYKIVYFEILKKIISKNGKMSNQKLGNIKNLGNLGQITPSFLVLEVSVLTRGLGFKKLEKTFWDFRGSRDFHQAHFL